MDDFGKKLRQIRRKKLITLKQLAERTKLSVGFLSEIERNLAQPSMSSLKKITQTLDISLFNFRQDQTNGSMNENPMSLHRDSHTYIKDIRVVRAGNRKKLLYPNRPVVYELLCPDLNGLLEILYIRLEPGFHSGPEPIIDPPGEKFLFVLNGSVEYRIREEVICLDKGDSMYYPANSPCILRVLGEGACELIGVVTPPGF